MKIYENKKCLNGWWDYCCADSDQSGVRPPGAGWHEGKYLVPSLVNKSLGGVRKQGETYYQEYLGKDPQPFADGEYEFLFDNDDYPVEWTAKTSGWARRTLTIDQLDKARRYFLQFDAIAARSEVWLNGQQVATHEDAFLPQSIDVTEQLVEGDNELIVTIRDYERLPDNRSKTLTPSGNMMTAHMRGIWQDVWLIERAEVYVVDSTIQTSYREKTLTVLIEIANASASEQTVELTMDVSEWTAEVEASAGVSVLDVPNQRITLGASERSCVSVTVPWESPKLWQPESPHLYWLRSTVTDSVGQIDAVAERFGFREVWIEGPDFMLNGFPVHFFSDWGHKLNQLNHTKAWNECWFAMLKAENFNHSRLHTHPHPKLVMDMADEAGIMITGETAIHGSGGEQAADAESYWAAARQHIEGYIRRDKNHPSLLLWSVENEMRWNQDTTDRTKKTLPNLYTLFRELDPTREAYHEGDSSLWDESQQAIMSRHYGKECGGYGWWNKQRPLHAGEMSAYHYMGPNTNFHTGGGDSLWANYQEVVEAVARETLWIVEAGRTQGTAAFGPWNISCLSNLRMETERVTLDYADWTTPGIKPRYINPHTAEYAFWREAGSHYTPFGQTNAIQAHGFRPFALIDLSHRRSYFQNSVAERELYLVNDTAAAQSGELRVGIEQSQQVIFEAKYAIKIERGHVFKQLLELELPELQASDAVNYKVSFINEQGDLLDHIDEDWKLSPKIPLCGANRSAKITVVGEGSSQAWLDAMGYAYDTIGALDAPVAQEIDLLILECDTVCPGTQQNQWIENFMQGGGQVLLLEQKYSLFPEVVLESKPQLHSYLRSYQHPVLEGFEQANLQFWGEDPFASLRSDAHVAHRVYQKGGSCLLQPVVDAGEGGIGLKLPEWTVLGEVKCGAGKLLASQFRFRDKGATIPEAGRLFAAMLTYLIPVKAEVIAAKAFAEAEADDLAAVESALATAASGGNALVHLRDAAAVATIGQSLEIDLSAVEGLRYQAVRSGDLPELSGISNVDTCGIDGMTYCFNIESLALANLALKKHPRIEPLLVTPTKAMLEEFHIYGQRPEPLRTHATSRFLYAEAPEEHVMLGRIQHGAGYVYLDVFYTLDQAHPRLARYASLLKRNLGARLASHALTGDAVPQAIDFSQGFPVQICTQAVGSAERATAMRSNTALPAERMAPTNMLGLGGWGIREDASGKWPTIAGKETALYTCLHSPRPRKIVMEDSGIPNPESLTFLDVFADTGTVELSLNGVPQGSKALQGGQATFSDLELVHGFNQLLILWQGADSRDTLHFRFRDIMQNPETELVFLVAKPDLQSWKQSEF